LSNSQAGLTRFVILAAPRTGSNWLCSLLNSHPGILCHHEVFNPNGIFYALDFRDGAFDLGTIEERNRRPLEFLSRIWQHPLGTNCVGFKMTRGQDEHVLQAVLSDR
jgi:LPS sulfotransferase NodH